MKLGKLAPRHDRRTLMLGNYVQPQLPTPPDACGWEFKVDDGFGLMLNDRLGDCTVAAAGHLIEVWTANAGNMFIPSDHQILTAYKAVSGYNDIDPDSDAGAVELDVLNYWRKTGIAGRTIGAFAALEPSNEDHIRDSVFLFGGCYIGVQLPVSAQDQDVWVVPPYGATGEGAPGSWGGHAVPVVGYGRRGLTVVTWGKLLRMSWQFWRAYVDESYAILSPDFLAQDRAPNGFNLQQLQADLSAITAA
jgi:hypothetical protein